MRVLSVAISMLAFMTAGMAAAQETFDIATFEAPPGWERLPLPDRFLLRTAPGDTQIVLFPSLMSATSPAENFEADWARIVTATLGPVDAPQVSSVQGLDGWTGVVGVTRVTRDGESVGLILVTTTGFGRSMSVLASFTRQEHVPDVTRFFEHLVFQTVAPSPSEIAQRPLASVTAPPAPAATAGSTEEVAVAPGSFADGVPNGLFYRVTAGLTTYSRVTAETRLFLPGNRIIRAFPYGGGDTFAMSRCLPDQCGAYRIDPGYLTVTWENHRVDQWTLSRSSDVIDIDGATFRPAQPMLAAALLGRWSAASSDGNPYANVYRFERDSTFTFGTESSTSLKGRFAVEGMTLILSFADGSEERRTLFVASTGGQIGLICIDGEVFSG